MLSFAHVLSLMLSALITLLPGVAFLFGGTPAEVPQTIRRTLAWGTTTPGQLLELSNTRGDVRIVAEDRSDVSIVATRTVDRQGDANEPGPDVDFRQESGRLLVCGDNSHCGCHVDWSRDGWRGDERTRVRVDFDVRVPRQATLDVCAVNGGRLRVEGTEGRYTLRHVNGAIEMVGVRGAGRASTVNGDLRATFVGVPNAPAEFKTVNGRVDVTLPATLSADLRLRTLHGGLYTDFDTTPLPSKTTTDRRTGRLVYRSDRFASVRVGSGGPELTFETVNGDVQVRKR